MTEEHARELLAILAELDHLQQCASRGIDPVSGRSPRGMDRQQALVERLGRNSESLCQHYDDALAAYADGFGWEASEELDRFVRAAYCGAPLKPLPPVQRELF